ncbi:MAG: glycosyltransferase family 2 protein [Chromatiaceae bacterium]|nr:MAG: glycosyltransferase family 2 protein [Chromatiaceae bacterium]
MIETPALAVVVPTFNEAGNVVELLTRLRAVLDGIAWEVIFVDDDSADGTGQVVCREAQTDGRVRLIRRIGRRGLASAGIEGMLATCAPFVAVIDADLQHDERILPEMLRMLRAEDLDIVVASRHLAGGGIGDWGRERAWASRIATKLARTVLKADLTDPMSGFFMLRRDLLAELAGDLSGIGFKLLLDIFATAPRPLRCRELPYTFRLRMAGESKLDAMVVWEYLYMLLDKSLGRYVPVRFIPFALVGGLGVLVHMVVLWLIFIGMAGGFVLGQTIATLVAMTFNFFVNNLLTYRDRRLRGWQLLRGWISFTLACGLGAVANVGIATYLFHSTPAGGGWWVLSAVAGILVGAVWNYAVTAVYTWNQPRRMGRI